MKALLALGIIQLLKLVVEANHVFMEINYNQGILVGVQENYKSRQFYSFKGIPYAQPPVGDLRFKDPVGNVKWIGKRKADADPPRCPQLEELQFVGNEDCLYLNVYTPQIHSKSFPVMVYIHGGDFLRGGASDYSPLPIMYNDVVLVIIQYRLGILGFLSTEDDVLPGNLGLKDQTMALHWVKENIGTFGGDLNRITILGSGSGGASVHYQILTPYAKGLFTGAIIQSGSSLCPRMLRENHRFVVTELDKKFLCCLMEVNDKIPYSERLLKCLKNVSAEDLTTSYIHLLEWQSLPILTVPRVDGDYIPDHPVKLIKGGRYNQVNIIAGTNLNDGSIITSTLYNDPVQWKGFKDNVDTIGSLTLAFDEERSPGYLAAIAYFKYFGDSDSTDQKGADLLTKLFTDRLFEVCVHDMIDLHLRTSDRNKIYLYRLQHRGSKSSCDNTSTIRDDHWVCHGDDVHLLFDNQFSLTLSEYEDDLGLESLIVKMWTNFAAHQNPTPTDYLGFLWEPYTTSNRNRLELKPDPSISNAADYNKTLLFWHSLSTSMNRYLKSNDTVLSVESSKGEQMRNLKGFPKRNPVFIVIDQTKKLHGLNEHTTDFNGLTAEANSDELVMYSGSLIMEDEDYHSRGFEIKKPKLTTVVLDRERFLRDPKNSFSSGGLHLINPIDDVIAAAGIWSSEVSPVFVLKTSRDYLDTPSGVLKTPLWFFESTLFNSGINNPSWHRHSSVNPGVDDSSIQTRSVIINSRINNPSWRLGSPNLEAYYIPDMHSQSVIINSGVDNPSWHKQSATIPGENDIFMQTRSVIMNSEIINPSWHLVSPNLEAYYIPDMHSQSVIINSGVNNPSWHKQSATILGENDIFMQTRSVIMNSEINNPSWHLVSPNLEAYYIPVMHSQSVIMNPEIDNLSWLRQPVINPQVYYTTTGGYYSPMYHTQPNLINPDINQSGQRQPPINTLLYYSPLFHAQPNSLNPGINPSWHRRPAINLGGKNPFTDTFITRQPDVQNSHVWNEHSVLNPFNSQIRHPHSARFPPEENILWNAPVQSNLKHRDYLQELLGNSRLCEIGVSSNPLKDDLPEDLNVYNLIEAGLLKATIVFKDFGDETHTIDNGNIRDLIRHYGNDVAIYLRKQKVKLEDIPKIRELYQIKNHAPHYFSLGYSAKTPTESLIWDKPEVAIFESYPDLNGKVRGSTERIVTERLNPAIPYLDPSGDS